jgi:hypothetical protein
MQRIAPCPNCGGNSIYLNKAGISGGGYAANYLTQLGTKFLRCAKLYPAICRDCGLTRFFTDAETRSRLEQAPQWEKQQTRTR